MNAQYYENIVKVFTDSAKDMLSREELVFISV